MSRNDTQTLIDRQALADVMSHYASAIDERDLARFRRLFAEDVEVVGFHSEPIAGADAWCRFVEKTLERFVSTQHMLGPQLATIGGDLADTRTDLQAIHLNREPQGSIFTLWGTYHTRMQRCPAGFRIVRHELAVRATQTLP